MNDCQICGERWSVIVDMARGVLHLCDDCADSLPVNEQAQREADFNAYLEMDWGTPMDCDWIAYE